ncbi:hypothetical protein A3K24_01155 [candidate division Kazan bacterium RIFCSPHIGHO2_01_FULL_44_14]|uniref:WxL domain-containing protein n=1 Tax=candidate division Kazan bacterium RIFCSPLOWO2_01_FULL_45_19 TaxID=1798538 RepID=A0A1F4NPS7_UNCK3|nr:hypothetical protein [uncultured bacterium]OGB73454.1 MAG: hypothetical protein A3K51_01155 [candidate division Kazan bacterium RIFCSPLOWO2_01_FULL_45_19]OGB77699.1 MAG: hypothetical protein A3K24_01155 [candidate division Kazan bacterium RIFCSPHIGHO2_01_FULL_44_14]
MKNKVTKFIQLQAERNRQLLVLGAVLFVSGVMASGVIQITRAGTTDNTNVNIVVTAGSLSIAMADVQFDVGSGGPGTANVNSIAWDGLANAITIADTTGSGSGWSTTAYFVDNFISAGAEEMAIASLLNWYPGDMTIANGTGNNAHIGPGANSVFAGTGAGNPLTFAGNNSAGTAAGSFNMHNVKMEYDIPVSAVATSYSADLLFTIA